VQELAYVSSRELVGKPLEMTNTKLVYSNLSPTETADKEDVDCWVMALPNGVCSPWVQAIQRASNPAVIVDLSADYRFDSSWTYGLPELYSGTRDKVKASRQISNPGCYATGTQMALAPLIENNLVDALVSPVVFGVSGWSGAGTKPSPKNNPAMLKDNFMPYALSGHMHEREVSFHLHRANSNFKQGTLTLLEGDCRRSFHSACG
jgi:N-acetyl-gamma-glutamyl-phosphate reductase/acetylglutamate kinase